MIFLAPLHKHIPGAVPLITGRLRKVFRTDVVEFHPSIDHDAAFSAERHQYNSTALLMDLLRQLPRADAKLVAITDVDLYIPVLTFVFGEAQLGGNVAIASSFRLRNSWYGLPEDHELMLARLEKEVVHELGHTFNLKHCTDYACAMHASTYVEDIDLKQAKLCPECDRLVSSPNGD